METDEARIEWVMVHPRFKSGSGSRTPCSHADPCASFPTQEASTPAPPQDPAASVTCPSPYKPDPFCSSPGRSSGLLKAAGHHPSLTPNGHLCLCPSCQILASHALQGRPREVWVPSYSRARPGPRALSPGLVSALAAADAPEASCRAGLLVTVAPVPFLTGPRAVQTPQVSTKRCLPPPCTLAHPVTAVSGLQGTCLPPSCGAMGAVRLPPTQTSPPLLSHRAGHAEPAPWEGEGSLSFLCAPWGQHTTC